MLLAKLSAPGPNLVYVTEEWEEGQAFPGGRGTPVWPAASCQSHLASGFLQPFTHSVQTQARPSLGPLLPWSLGPRQNAVNRGACPQWQVLINSG